MSQYRQFVVDRSTLLTGAALRYCQKQGHDPLLFDAFSGLSCILGQYLQALGVSRKHLAGKHDLTNLLCALPPEANWLMRTPKEQTSVAYEINEANDSPTLHQIRREQKLRKLFASQNIALEFVGMYADATKRAKIAFAH